MNNMMNPKTAKLETDTSLDRGLVVVYIVRLMFDRKMAAILSDAGSALRQICTSTHRNLEHKDLMVDGFPINRLSLTLDNCFGY